MPAMFRSADEFKAATGRSFGPTDWLVVEKDPRSLPGRVLWSLPTPEGLAVTTRALREWLGLAVLHAFGSGRPHDDG